MAAPPQGPSQGYPKSSVYAPYSHYYQNSSHSPYMPPPSYMMGQQGYKGPTQSQNQPSSSSQGQQSQPPYWCHPSYMYNMQMGGQQGSGSMSSGTNYGMAQHQKYMGYPYMKPPPNSSSEDHPEHYERK